ncbi:hypothetical protein [Roseinatronobacter bogoriensis]|nr:MULTISPECIES: hypothetical protein [Rhodobaca]
MLHVSVIARLGDTAASVQDGPWVLEGASGDVVIPAARLLKEVTDQEVV